MFDISFSELLVIALVALIVIGPERLPRVARVVGLMAGRVRRYAQDFRQEINREIELDELKRLQEEVVRSANALETSVRLEMETARTALDETDREIRAPLAEVATIPLANPDETESDAASDPPPKVPAA
ncbi:MAG: Sec-independent protein translocase protein TatB [Zoogloeaceae bacterium]|jgi:sec-independent protein translocase protein TatB|nr:Sec-independent protein translocase protein TatB [Zoogloeaceae bacterium]